MSYYETSSIWDQSVQQIITKNEMIFMKKCLNCFVSSEFQVQRFLLQGESARWRWHALRLELLLLLMMMRVLQATRGRHGYAAPCCRLGHTGQPAGSGRFGGDRVAWPLRSRFFSQQFLLLSSPGNRSTRHPVKFGANQTQISLRKSKWVFRKTKWKRNYLSIHDRK